MLRFLTIWLISSPVFGQPHLVKSLTNKKVQAEAEILMKQVEKQIKKSSSDSTLVSFSMLEAGKNCYYTKDGRAFTGSYYRYDSSNYIITAGLIKEGKEDHLRIEFGKDEKLRSIKFVNDSGICYNWQYYDNGHLETYLRNKSGFDCINFNRLFGGYSGDGDCYEFYENGNLREKYFMQDNCHSKKWFRYYDNGKPKEVVFFEKSEMAGVWKQYSRKGKCMAKIYFENGKSIKEKGTWVKSNELK